MLTVDFLATMGVLEHFFVMSAQELPEGGTGYCPGSTGVGTIFSGSFDTYKTMILNNSFQTEGQLGTYRIWRSCLQCELVQRSQ